MFFSKGKEVVELVDKHLKAVNICYKTYEEGFTKLLISRDEQSLKHYCDKLNMLETEADTLRHEIIRKMLDGGLLVDSRKSLMHIIEGADTVADLTENIFNMIYLEGISIKDYMIEPIKAMNEITHNQLELLINAIEQVIYKFDMDQLYDIIRKIEQLESEVDIIEKQLLKDVFTDEIPLSMKLHYKQLINSITDISDLIEDISDAIEIVMLARKV